MKTRQEQTKQHASKKFKTILADPPWEIAQKGKLGASRHYNLMSLEAIKNIPVTDLAGHTLPPSNNLSKWCALGASNQNPSLLG